MACSAAAGALRRAGRRGGAPCWRAEALPPPPRGARGVAGSGRTCDAVIIGGGVLGSACALELRKKGYTTLNVDAGPSPGYGSTSSSSAIVRHFYSMEDACRLAWDSYHYWKDWGDHLEAPPGEELCELHEVGCAVVDAPASPQATTYLSRVRSAMAACNVPIEEWDVAECQRRMPYMSTRSYFPPRRVEHDQFGEDNGGDIAGILFCPRGGYVNDPQLAARNLADAAKRRGAEFRWRARVAGIDRRSGGARVAGVTLEDGSSIEAPIVINAAGPHSQAIHDLAFQGASGPADDSKVSAKPMKVEVAYVQEPPGARADETLPVIADIDVGVYYRPQLGGQVLIGSVEPECDELHFLSHADEMQPGLTDEWNELVYRAALRLPTLKVPNTASGLVALYDSTPDFTPIYDKTSLGGLYSIRGTSGNQFKNAPVVGKICATLVDGVENGRDHDVEPLSLPLERASGTLNLGIYSRLRGKQASTGSVLG